MTISDYINIAIAIITLITLLVTLVLTTIQIRLSNKHQLFDRRLKNYEIIRKTVSWYSNNRNALSNLNDNSILNTTNHMAITYSDAFGEKRKRIELNIIIPEDEINNIEELREHASELRTIAIETLMIWKGIESNTISSFLFSFSELLISLINHDKHTKEMIQKTSNNVLSSDLVEHIKDTEFFFNKIKESDALQKIIAQTKLIK